MSTDEQEGALQAQVSRLEAAGCDLIIREMVSGRQNDRPGIVEAMALVKIGRVEELVITRVDRLGRDAAYADELIALCAIHGVTIRALDGGVIESASPQGFFMARTMTTIAEMESRMLSMRIKKQLQVYRQQGRHLRRRKPFGYRGGPDHRLEPDPEQWPLALRVLDELRARKSFSHTAMSLPAWCPWTPAAGNLQAWFCNPIIRGHTGYGRSKGKGWGVTWREILYDTHPALISEGAWQELADDLRRTRNRFDGRPQVEARHGLTGLLRCATCGRRMRRSTSNGTPWWRCCHRLCEDRGRVKEATILPVVVAECVAAAEALAAAAALPPDDDPRVAGKRRDLEAMRDLAIRNPVMEAAVAALEAEIEGMMRRERPQPDLVIYQSWMADPAFFSEATAEEQRALFGAVLAEVRVGPGGEGIRAVRRSW